MVDRIQTGVWPEGARVPSENTLMQEFGTSRGPVRQALARLRTEGLIIGGRGAPPRVNGSVPTQSFDTYISFTEWAEEIGRELSQKTIEVTQKIAEEQISRAMGLRGDGFIVEIVRLRRLDGEPVMIERSIYPMEFGKYLISEDLEVRSIYRILREHGISPIRARNVIDAVAAGAFEAQWLGVEIGSPLLRVFRTSFDKEGRVVDIVENKYLPNKATFAIDNTRNNLTPLTRIPAEPREGIGAPLIQNNNFDRSAVIDTGGVA